MKETHLGKFRLTQKLGLGGMGEVWKAWDSEIGRWVALKLLIGDDSYGAERFLREARMAGALSHPNIAAIYEMGEAAGRKFIAMQFVDGVTFNSFRKGDARLLVRMLRDAALAVHFAHEHGIIHRDLKPENLMATSAEPPVVYVMDFGLARQAKGASDLTGGKTVGTPSYMSPEQARGLPLDRRSDVHAFGATMYFLFTGRTPFEAETLPALLRKIVRQEPAPPQRINAELATVILKCLEKDPGRRYASCEDLAADLSRWLDGKHVLARRPGLANRAARFASIHRIALIVSLASTAAVLGLAMFFLRESKAQRLSTTKEAFEKSAATERQETMRELNGMWARIVTAREWMRQAGRDPLQIRKEMLDADRDIAAFVERHPKLAQGWYVRARARMYLGHFLHAQEALEKGLGLDPGFQPCLTLLGQVELKRYLQSLIASSPETGVRRIHTAMPILEHAVETLKKSGRSHAEGVERWGLTNTDEDRAIESLSEGLYLAFIVKDPDAARDFLVEAVERTPSEEICLWISYLSGTHAERMTWITRAIDISPHDGATYVARGVERAFSGDESSEVLADFDKALLLNPTMAVAYNNRAVYLIRKDRFEEAIRDCSNAIAQEPDSYIALVNRGYALLRLSRNRESLADLDRCIAVNAHMATAYCWRGHARMALGDLAGAFRDSERAIELDSKWLPGHLLRGLVYKKQGDLDHAGEAFAKALRLEPNSAEAHLHMADFRLERRDYPEALHECDRALEISPGMASAWRLKGDVFVEQKNAAEAVRCFTRAIEMNPRDMNAYFKRANILPILGRFEEAISDYTRCLELNPSNLEALANRGLARKFTRDFTRAVEDLENALRVAPADLSARSQAERWLKELRDAGH